MQDTIVKIPKSMSEAKVPTLDKRDWKGHRGERGATLTECHALPQDQHRATQMGHPGPIFSPVEKSKLKRGMQLPQCCGTPHRRLPQVSPHRDHEGNLWSSITGNQIETDRVPTVAGTQTLADHIPAYSSTRAKIPATGTAHPQSQVSGPVWLRSSVGSSAWFGSPAKGPH